MRGVGDEPLLAAHGMLEAVRGAVGGLGEAGDLVAGLGHGDPALPETLVSRKLTGSALVMPIENVLDRYAVAGPDGVRLLLMGMPEHAEQGCLCGGHATVSALLSDLRADPDIVAIVDMEASPEHLSRGTARHADLLLLVAEPYFRSLESVRRQAVLAAELPIGRVEVVANKVRSPRDADAISERVDRVGERSLLRTEPHVTSRGGRGSRACASR